MRFAANTHAARVLHYLEGKPPKSVHRLGDVMQEIGLGRSAADVLRSMQNLARGGYIQLGESTFAADATLVLLSEDNVPPWPLEQRRVDALEAEPLDIVRRLKEQPESLLRWPAGPAGEPLDLEDMSLQELTDVCEARAS